MEQRLQDVLTLARCGLRDEIPKLSGTQDWPGIFRLAANLKMTPFVQYGLKLGAGLDCPGKIYEAQMQELHKKALGRVIAAGELAGLQEELQKLGIPTAVVKGQALATAYRHPELRAGCDIDLYVEEAKERAVYDWAGKLGLSMERRVPGTHHGKIIHPVLGLIELHVSLCNGDEALVESTKAKDALLVHPVEPFCILDNCGNQVVTLGMTDHMLFIVNHMVNHYLHGEAQLRMLADVNSFFGAYHRKMDENRLREALRQLKYDRMFSIVLAIGNHDLGFSHSPEWVEGVSAREREELLLDFCQGEFEKESALRVYDTYCRGTMSGGWKDVIFKLKILKVNVRTALQLRHQMSLHQMAAIGWRRMKNMFSPFASREGKEISPETARRLSLIRQMGMMD